MDVNKLMAELERKHPGESEYLQAVREVLMTVEEAYNQHPEFEANRIAERIVEPDRIFTFKVVWVDDKGDVQVNIGYRIQFNNAIGPYKGFGAISGPRPTSRRATSAWAAAKSDTSTACTVNWHARTRAY